jgi:5-deoxy-glucuronate isomerase
MKKFHEVLEGEGLLQALCEGPLKNIKLLILRTKKRISYNLSTKDVETILLPLFGEFFVNIEEREFALRREDPFSQRSDALYIPEGREYNIVGTGELAVCNVKGKKGFSTFFIKKEDVKERRVGNGSYLRVVRDIVTEDVQTASIIVGETLSFEGRWSSFPPHRHDDTEELYFFKLNPPSGFGMQRIYKEEFDISIPLKNNTAVAIPFGYHPVVGAPMCTLYYLWIIASRERRLHWNHDDAFIRSTSP